MGMLWEERTERVGMDSELLEMARRATKSRFKSSAHCWVVMSKQEVIVEGTEMVIGLAGEKVALRPSEPRRRASGATSLRVRSFGHDSTDRASEGRLPRAKASISHLSCSADASCCSGCPSVTVSSMEKRSRPSAAGVARP